MGLLIIPPPNFREEGKFVLLGGGHGESQTMAEKGFFILGKVVAGEINNIFGAGEFVPR